MILGLDSRYWDGTRPPAALGFKFYYGKVSEGGWRPDNVAHLWLQHQRDACRYLKIPYGGYHYWRQYRSPIEQVDAFASRLDKPELPSALDFEDPYATTGAGAKILAFVREAVTVIGRSLVYTRKSWWDKWVNAEQAAEIASLCDLWVADYGFDGWGDGPGRPLMPRGWMEWVIWQYAGDKKVPGMSGGVDFDRAKDDWFARYS